MTDTQSRTERRCVPDALGRHLRSPTTRRAMLVQQQVLMAVREHLASQGFVELLPPILGPVTDPGIRGSKQLDVDYYGHRFKLMTSAILYKQASLPAFPRLFYLAPNVRAEPPETAATGRHLTEFHQIDVEIAHADRAEAERVATGLFTHVVQRVMRTAPEELISLGRDLDELAATLSRPFEVLTHAEAVARLHRLGHAQNPAAEIDWEGEEMLSRGADRPFFIDDYPHGSRGFYDRQSTTDPRVLRNFDLIAPGGYGEIVSGAEREHDYARIVTRMRQTGENPAKYGWYLDAARQGFPPSAGFGMGLQRLTRFLTGLEHVWQVHAYPKLPGIVAP